MCGGPTHFVFSPTGRNFGGHSTTRISGRFFLVQFSKNLHRMADYVISASMRIALLLSICFGDSDKLFLEGKTTAGRCLYDIIQQPYNDVIQLSIPITTIAKVSPVLGPRLYMYVRCISIYRQYCKWVRALWI